MLESTSNFSATTLMPEPMLLKMSAECERTLKVSKLLEEAKDLLDRNGARVKHLCSSTHVDSKTVKEFCEETTRSIEKIKESLVLSRESLNILKKNSPKEGDR